MTVKRREFRKILGKHYPMPWKKLKPGYTEEVYSTGGEQTLSVLPDSDSISFTPIKGDEIIIDVISKDDINHLREGQRYYRMLGLKNGFENDRIIELGWEPTLPPTARR